MTIHLANITDVVKIDNLMANARRLSIATHGVIATRITKSTSAFKQWPGTMQALKGAHADQ